MPPFKCIIFGKRVLNPAGQPKRRRQGPVERRSYSDSLWWQSSLGVLKALGASDIIAEAEGGT